MDRLFIELRVSRFKMINPDHFVSDSVMRNPATDLINSGNTILVVSDCSNFILICAIAFFIGFHVITISTLQGRHKEQTVSNNYINGTQYNNMHRVPLNRRVLCRTSAVQIVDEIGCFFCVVDRELHFRFPLREIYYESHIFPRARVVFISVLARGITPLIFANPISDAIESTFSCRLIARISC